MFCVLMCVPICLSAAERVTEERRTKVKKRLETMVARVFLLCLAQVALIAAQPQFAPAGIPEPDVCGKVSKIDV